MCIQLVMIFKAGREIQKNDKRIYPAIHDKQPTHSTVPIDIHLKTKSLIKPVDLQY